MGVLRGLGECLNEGVMSHTRQDKTKDGARVRGKISQLTLVFFIPVIRLFFDGAICLGWCDILKVMAIHTDGHTTKRGLRNQPYLSYLISLFLHIILDYLKAQILRGSEYLISLFLHIILGYIKAQIQGDQNT